METSNEHGLTHIKKQLKSNKSRGYSKFGKCIFDVVEEDELVWPVAKSSWNPLSKRTFIPRHETINKTASIHVNVEVGDEVRIWSTGHFVVELVKRSEDPKNDISYTFGFGIAPSYVTSFLSIINKALQTSISYMVNTYTKIAFVIGSLDINQGAFYSPDPIFEKAVPEYLKTGKGIKLLGVCRIDESDSSFQLRSALNSIFSYVNTSINPTIGQYKDGSYWVNAVIPELYTSLPLHCPYGQSHNCASFFQSFISSELLICAIKNVPLPIPSLCYFGKDLGCTDCAQRDLLYLNSTGGNRRKTRKHKKGLRSRI